jgi:hypothetical protein
VRLLDVFDVVWSRALEDEREERVTIGVFRYCHHCQKPIRGHQFQFVPNKFLCGKCWNFRYVLASYEDRLRPGSGDRISDEPMKFD